ncbi:hypothetical protein YC2023_108801 [Brassica napus]
MALLKSYYVSQDVGERERRRYRGGEAERRRGVAAERKGQTKRLHWKGREARFHRRRHIIVSCSSRQREREA